MKLNKAVPKSVKLPKCSSCGAYAVYANMCMKCRTINAS